jgi:hypothetical protein
MDKRKNTKGQTMIYKQYNEQKKKDQGTNNDIQTEGQTIQSFVHCIVCPCL